MSWWVVYSEPMREFLARDELVHAVMADRGLPHLSLTRDELAVAGLKNEGRRVLLPFSSVTERRSLGRRSRLVEEDRPLFPRYLFVEGASFQAVTRTRGVYGVLTDWEGFPLAVPEQHMSKLLAVAGTTGQVTKEDRSRLSWAFHGQVGSIFVFMGPLEGARGKIVSLDALDTRGEVDVEFKLLGKTNVRRVPSQQVGKIINDGLRVAAA